MKTHMPKKSEMRIEMHWVPQTWYGRLFATVAGALLLWFGILFFTVFLIVFGLVFAVVIARLVWVINKNTKVQPSSVIETEYHVEENEKANRQNIKNKIEKNLKRK